MSMLPTEERTCRYPGCARMAMAGEPGAGRPPEYCDDPSHTRASAWRARQRLRTDVVGGVGEPTRPVDVARQRASEITGQVTGMIEHLGQQLTVLVEELRTVGDPDAAAAQMESVTSEAAEQVAAANARAVRAEQAQRRAEGEREEADAAATEATATAGNLSLEVERVRGELAAATEEALQLREGLTAAEASLTEAQDRTTVLEVDLKTAQAALAQAYGDRDTAVQEARENARSRAAAEQQAAAAGARSDAEAARAIRAEDTVAEVRGTLDAVRVDMETARETTAQLRSDVARLTAERDAARADIERERTHAEERIQDLHTTYLRQLTDVRAELDKIRAPGKPEASEAEAPPPGRRTTRARKTES